MLTSDCCVNSIPPKKTFLTWATLKRSSRSCIREKWKIKKLSCGPLDYTEGVSGRLVIEFKSDRILNTLVNKARQKARALCVGRHSRAPSLTALTWAKACFGETSHRRNVTAPSWKPKRVSFLDAFPHFLPQFLSNVQKTCWNNT